MIEKQEEEIAALKRKLERKEDEVHNLLHELKGYYEQGVCDCCEGSVANPANPANLKETTVKYHGFTEDLTYPTIK